MQTSEVTEVQLLNDVKTKETIRVVEKFREFACLRG